MSADDTYAPKSPDLSSFYSAGPTEHAPQHFHHPQAANSHPGLEYKTDPTYDYLSTYVAPSVQLNNHALSQPHYQPQPQHPPPPQQHTIKPEYQTYSPRLQQQRLSSSHSQRLPPGSAYGAHPPTSHPQQHAQPSFGSPYGDQILHPGTAQHQAQFYAHPPGSGAFAQSPNATATPHSSNMPPRKAAPPPAPIIEPSPVKTKFPTARIKRIMQADEEVGKVAQQTPIAVGKALELFMIQLVSKSADVAKEKGSKRVTAPMLKHVVETDEQWDFLRDIVSRVENEKEGSKAKAKAESSSDEEITEPKKRTRGGRKKKV